MSAEELWIPPRPGIQSVDSDPRKSTRQKILEIKKSRINVRKRPGYDDVYETHLHHTKGISFYIAEGTDDLTIWDIDLGNRELYGHGIGTRLLQRVVSFGLNKNSALETVSRGEGNWALAKTIGKVIGGSEFVSFEKGGVVYGERGDRPIEAVLEDHPFENENHEYGLQNVVGSIDEARLMNRETAERCVRIHHKAA